jgi:hypothetical protein
MGSWVRVPTGLTNLSRHLEDFRAACSVRG